MEVIYMANANPNIDDNRTLLRLAQALEEFESFSGTMPVSQVRTFFLVASHEGKSQGELAMLADLKVSTISRYLLDLSEKTRKGAEGYGLIRREADPQELRRNMYSLTPKGRNLASRIVAELRK